ncbi:MAG: hypothetical protein NPIRA02_16540 [Nitrospirales bacterium]|nr:MAG: hypothetical protein NPIRA02_16540 [Nitrospirales bacterium]
MGPIYAYGLMVVGFSLFFVRLNHLTEYVFIALVAIWAIEKLLTRDFQLRRTFLDWPIFLFLVWILVTGFFAVDSDYSLNEWRKALPRFLIFWFVVNAITTECQVRSILFASSLGLGVLSGVEVGYYFWNGGDLLDFSMSAASRAGVFTGSSQWLGTYVVLGSPLAVLGLWSEPAGIRRVAYGVICSLLLAALLLVHTRASWLAFLIELVLFGLLVLLKGRWQVQKVMIIASLVLLFILGLLGSGMVSLVADSQVTNSATLELRLNTWGFAIEQLVENPRMSLTGVGYGKHSFFKAFPDLGPGFHTHIHNSFLGRAMQVGLPGLLIFSLMFGMILVKSLRGWRACSHLYAGQLSLAIFLGTLGLIVRNLFDDMFVGTVVYVFCLFIGLLCAVFNLHDYGNTSRSNA